jgi:hypothetical protein
VSACKPKPPAAEYGLRDAGRGRGGGAHETLHVGDGIRQHPDEHRIRDGDARAGRPHDGGRHDEFAADGVEPGVASRDRGDVRARPAGGIRNLVQRAVRFVAHAVRRHPALLEQRADRDDARREHALTLHARHRQGRDGGAQGHDEAELVTAAQPDDGRDQLDEFVAAIIGDEVVHAAREGRKGSVGARGMVAPAFPGQVGGELHEACAAARIAMPARGQVGHDIGNEGGALAHRDHLAVFSSFRLCSSSRAEARGRAEPRRGLTASRVWGGRS